MPFVKQLYAQNWLTTIRPNALKRAGYKCQSCGVVNKTKGYRTLEGSFIECDEHMLAWAKRMSQKIIQIHLSVSHQNHDTTDNRPENLKVRCQRCHLSHDKELHRVSRISKSSALQLAPFSSIP